MKRYIKGMVAYAFILLVVCLGFAVPSWMSKKKDGEILGAVSFYELETVLDNEVQLSDSTPTLTSEKLGDVLTNINEGAAYEVQTVNVTALEVKNIKKSFEKVAQYLRIDPQVWNLSECKLLLYEGGHDIYDVVFNMNSDNAGNGLVEDSGFYLHMLMDRDTYVVYNVTGMVNTKGESCLDYYSDLFDDATWDNGLSGKGTRSVFYSRIIGEYVLFYRAEENVVQMGIYLRKG